MVRISYLDISAAMRLVIDEPESAALVEALVSERRLVASWLLHTEFHCAAGRHPEEVDVVAVNQILDAVDLVDLTRGDMLAAGAHSPLRSNDAIHLAVAIRLGVDELVTYDAELGRAATGVGIAVLTPGR